MVTFSVSVSLSKTIQNLNNWKETMSTFIVWPGFEKCPSRVSCVCLSGRAGWPRWRGGCRRGRSSRGARAGCTRHRTRQQWTAVPRTERGTVSVQAGAAHTLTCPIPPQKPAFLTLMGCVTGERARAFLQLLMVKNEGSHFSVVPVHASCGFQGSSAITELLQLDFSPCPKPGGRVALSAAEVGCYSCCVFPLLSSPDGSYTEEQSQETEMKIPATDFDDEFDDEEPLPTIGTCKALYTFEGITQTLPSFHWLFFFFLTSYAKGKTFIKPEVAKWGSGVIL